MPEKGVGEVGQSVYFGAHQLTLQSDGTWKDVGLVPKSGSAASAKKEQEKW